MFQFLGAQVATKALKFVCSTVAISLFMPLNVLSLYCDLPASICETKALYPEFPQLLETLEKPEIYFGSLNPGNSLEFCVKP